nr:MAG TPA: hypothetical protein [Caudoviricetes sp.]
MSWSYYTIDIVELYINSHSYIIPITNRAYAI